MAREACPEVCEKEAMELAPAAAPPPVESCRPPKLPSSAADADSIHVLAVDDNALERKLIEKLLRNASYKVTSVDSGVKALEVLGVGEHHDAVNSHHVNMVVTDYCMPGMSGYDLLKRVKEIPALKDIPVLIVSSENVPSRIQRCLDEGAQKFILKPMQMADVKLFKTYVCRRKQVTDEPSGVPCNKRKYGSEVCQAAQSPERRPRLSGLTAA